MANFFNTLGSFTVVGTALQDMFFAFTRDTDLDHIRPDATLPSLNWATAIKNADGSAYVVNMTNVQVSTDLIQGGNASDVLFGSNLSDAILYNNGTFGSGVGGFDSIEQFFLGGGNDFLDLTGHGAGGVDYAKDVTINAGDGDDIVIGGAGKDIIDGDAGNDLIFGYRGSDTIRGGVGNDTIYGDDLGFNGISGNDLLQGGAGNDTLYGGAGTDRLEGGDDNDVLYGGRGGDTLFGEAGDDTLYGDDPGTSGNDKLDGGSGNDTIFAGAGDDETYGGTGNDTMYGEAGNDFMRGDAGDDLLQGGAGNDTIDGAADIDTAIYSGNRDDYSIVLNADGVSFTITDLRPSSPDGVDLVKNVEFFQFADGTIPANLLNHPPVITSDGGGDTAALTIAENSTSVTTVVASDVDAGQTVTYSIAGGDDGALFTIDTSTGALSFASAPDFENPTDSDGNNIYNVIVRASDGNGGVDTQVISVTVSDVADGAAPVISSDGGGATASISIAENTTAVTTVVATDADGPTPSYVILGGADAALFAIDPATGALSFVSAPDAENPLDVGHDGTYEVIVGATDGANTDTQALSVTVTNVNDNAPVITSNGGGAVASLSIAENATAVTTVAATDADGTTPSYAIAGGADAALFGIDAATGELQFLTAPDFENPGDAGTDGTYEVIVSATDGLNTVMQTLNVTVTNANDNTPVISSNGGGATATLSIAENTSAVTTVAASDADGTVPTYVITGGADAALFSINATTGALQFIAPPDFEHPLDAGNDGTYNVIIGATDGTFTATQALAITVTDVSEVGRTITGTSGNNTITPTTANLALQTTALNDTIFALAGNDIIDGGGGADHMEGGVGNDTYTVDTYSDDGFDGNDDLVIEVAGAGTDLVNALVSYRLPTEVENLTLIGTDNINGTGNELNNIIIGNSGNNLLSGGLGNDTLTGNAGADVLDGGDGNDTLSGGADADTLRGGVGADKLDGGTGADIMEGGADDDTYTVDTFSDDGNSSNDDIVTELAGGGNDVVNASVSYILAAEVETLTLTGTAAINGTGNTLDNTINGNSANNILSGDLGNDTLNGNSGSDTLNGGDGNDSLFGGNDDDFLFGQAGSDTLQGGAGADLLDGGAGTDTLMGQAGSDRLIGGTGKDTMTGGTEADTFVFNPGDSSLNSANYDRITDFETGVDKIDFSFVSSPLASSAYAEGSITTNNYTTALATANSLMASGTVAVFVAGTTDGWLFSDTNNDSILDQATLLQGLNSTAKFDYLDIT
ncbi:calcium-binding protein [Nordella sp. HKS 07]|uniref:beta strand repeat-containing protein n=1 Tax=Nordella sp. HKS 07 TaxID=2712222 RepID=UPI0013E1E9AE|nr:cadherin domain-containing protein [Nordella sp. HKS 07]QIG49920.1 calcium-binding protein [Nordella sp. HKS 07]